MNRAAPAIQPTPAALAAAAALAFAGAPVMRLQALTATRAAPPPS